MTTSARDVLDTVDAADMTGLSRRRLEQLRIEGAGPPYCKIGRRVLYLRTDIMDWVRSHRVISTSNATVAAQAGHLNAA